MRTLSPVLLTPALLVPLLLLPSAALAGPGSAMPVDIGAGVRLNAQGTYDVGKEVGIGALRNDLGPATLNFEGFAGLRPTTRLRIAGEFGIGIGGIVKTDERYFGDRSNVGSTITLSAKASVGYSLGYTQFWRYRAGAVAGVERRSDATGFGFVRLDTGTVGSWLEVGTAGGWSLQLRAELHKPYHAEIQGRIVDSSPSGHFSTIGMNGAYTFSVGGI